MSKSEAEPTRGESYTSQRPKINGSQFSYSPLSTGGPQSTQKLGTQGTQPEGWQSQTTSPKEISTPVTLTPCLDALLERKLGGRTRVRNLRDMIVSCTF